MVQKGWASEGDKIFVPKKKGNKTELGVLIGIEKKLPWQFIKDSRKRPKSCYVMVSKRDQVCVRGCGLANGPRKKIKKIMLMLKKAAHRAKAKKGKNKRSILPPSAFHRRKKLQRGVKHNRGSWQKKPPLEKKQNYRA